MPCVRWIGARIDLYLGVLLVNDTTSGCVSVYFHDLKAHLLHHISRADAVVGCVAW